MQGVHEIEELVRQEKARNPMDVDEALDVIVRPSKLDAIKRGSSSLSVARRSTVVAKGA